MHPPASWSFSLRRPGPLAASVDVQRILDTSRLGDPFVFDADPAGAVLVLTRDNFSMRARRNSFSGNPEEPRVARLRRREASVPGEWRPLLSWTEGFRGVLDVPLKSRVFASDGKRTYIGGITETGRALLFLYKGWDTRRCSSSTHPSTPWSSRGGSCFFPSDRGSMFSGRAAPRNSSRTCRAFRASLPSRSMIKAESLDFSDGDNLYAVHGGDFCSLSGEGSGECFGAGKAISTSFPAAITSCSGCAVSPRCSPPPERSFPSRIREGAGLVPLLRRGGKMGGSLRKALRR